MVHRLRPAVVIVSCAIAFAHIGARLGAQDRFSRQLGDRFHSKLVRIVELGKTERARASAPTSTQLTDVEVTAYLRHHARDQVPLGIIEPELKALGDGRVGGRAIVDLDAVRAQKQRGWLDPLAYLTGRLPLEATGMLITQDGVGRFQLESASISGVTIPKTVLQELLSFYSRTAEDPDGINMDDPFELPSRIREIRVGRGDAIVIQ